MNQGVEETRSLVRRRRSRTHRHRRNRVIRRVLFVAICSVGALSFGAISLFYLSPSIFRAARQVEPERQSAEDTRNLFLATQQEALRQMETGPVYRYSIIPGGVRDAGELKWVADHDPVVRSHYAGFDYDRARVVRLVLARSVYVSYRIGNKVYWTRRRIKLQKGERVITDGRITARARCGNRVEEMPQQATSSSEPPAVAFDEPIRPLAGTAITSGPPPVLATIANRAPTVAPLGFYNPVGGGNLTPIVPPPLPGVCGIGKKKPHKPPKKGGDPCAPGGGGVAPEPSTWLLMLCGTAAIYWVSRRRIAQA